MLDIGYNICPCIGSASVKEKGSYQQIATRLRNPFPPCPRNITMARRNCAAYREIGIPPCLKLVFPRSRGGAIAAPSRILKWLHLGEHRDQADAASARMVWLDEES